MLDELLVGRDAREVFDSGELFRELKKALVERILDAEMERRCKLVDRSGA